MTPSANGRSNGSSSLPTFHVEVSPKFGSADAPGQSLLGQIPLLGIAGCREVRVSSLYEISGRLTSAQVHQLSRDLLSDPVTQEYRIDSSATSPAFLLGPHWRIEVWLKPSVTDPAGESVRKAVTDLGLPAPEGVRTGAAYRLLGRMNQAQVERIAVKLLANPVIHRARVTQL